MARLKWRTRFNDEQEVAEQALAADDDPTERATFARRRLDAINEQLKTEDGDVLELEREKDELERELKGLGVGDPARDSGSHINALARINDAQRDHWASKSKPRDEARKAWDRAVSAGKEVKDRAIMNDSTLSMPQRLEALQRITRAKWERDQKG